MTRKTLVWISIAILLMLVSPALAQSTNLTPQNVDQIQPLELSPFAEDTAPTSITSPDGLWVAVLDDAGQVEVRSTSDEDNRFTITGYDVPPQDIFFSPDAQLLVTTSPLLNQVRVIEIANQRQTNIPGMAPVLFSPDSQKLALVRDDTVAVVLNVAGVISERETDLVAELRGHYARINAMSFSPDGVALLTAAQDGTVGLWDVMTGSERYSLMGHRYAVTALAWTGNLLASGDAGGSIVLWDATSGELLRELVGHPNAILRLTLERDGLRSWGADQVSVLWGIGDAVDYPADFARLSIAEVTTPPITDAMLANAVSGSARDAFSAGSHPDYPVGCTVAKLDRILALGQSADGAILALVPQCEAPVWLGAGMRFITWDEVGALATLPVIDVSPSMPRLRLTASTYQAICEQASGRASLSEGVPRLYPLQAVPSAYHATLESGAQTVICHDYQLVTIENCHYLGPRNYSYIFIRKRTDDHIRLVDAASGGIVAERRFQGITPPACPDSTTRGEVEGDPAPSTQWMPWVLESLGVADNAPIRTVTRRDAVARYDAPDGSVLGQLPANSPLNLLGKNRDGSWLLALLPDLSRGWFAREDITVAFTTDVAALPDTSAVIITPMIAESNQNFDNLAGYRPLGRFNIPGTHQVTSPDGLLVASLLSQSIDTPDNPDVPAYQYQLSMWDLRGGAEQWRVTLPQRPWVGLVFSPTGDSLFLLADENYSAGNTVSLSIFDTVTGQPITQISDIDVYQSPPIPGDMPQDIYARPSYARNGSQILVNYTRRANEPRCAVWRLADGSIAWQIEQTCGALSPDGAHTIVTQPYTSLDSSYQQLVVIEIESGALLRESVDEALDYVWLDNQNVLIHRPYGKAPVIWNVADNSRAVMELPQWLGRFRPQALDRVLFYRASNLTFVWDLQTGELLGNTSLEGHIVEQESRVLLLDYEITGEGDDQRAALVATNLESAVEVWRIPWTYVGLTLLPDRQTGFAFDDESENWVILDFVSGQIIGMMPIPHDDLRLSPDVEWVIQHNYGYIIIWGDPDSGIAFDDPPHARAAQPVQLYYEANTRFEAYPLPAERYIWAEQVSADGEWVEIVDTGGVYGWAKRSDLEWLRPLDDVPVSPR